MIENWNDETLLFDKEEEVGKMVSYNIFNCNNCTIEIVGKVQNVQMMSCKKTTVVVDSLISQMEVFKCQASVIKTKTSVPIVNIEGSNQTHVHLNNATKGCKISTSCTRSTIVFYPKAGMTDEQLDNLDNFEMCAVPEVYLTTINEENKLNTEGFLLED